MGLSPSNKQAGSGGKVAAFHQGGTDFVLAFGQPNESEGVVEFTMSNERRVICLRVIVFFCYADNSQATGGFDDE